MITPCAPCPTLRPCMPRTRPQSPRGRPRRPTLLSRRPLSSASRPVPRNASVSRRRAAIAKKRLNGLPRIAGESSRLRQSGSIKRPEGGQSPRPIRCPTGTGTRPSGRGNESPGLRHLVSGPACVTFLSFCPSGFNPRRVHRLCKLGSSWMPPGHAKTRMTGLKRSALAPVSEFVQSRACDSGEDSRSC
jgi:hypothetical protein